MKLQILHVFTQKCCVTTCLTNLRLCLVPGINLSDMYNVHVPVVKLYHCNQHVLILQYMYMPDGPDGCPQAFRGCPLLKDIVLL